MARELPENEGADVHIANNGLEAAEAVAAADPPFDVVLLDLQMPVMDNYTGSHQPYSAGSGTNGPANRGDDGQRHGLGPRGLPCRS